MRPAWETQPRISTAYQYRGIDTAILENSHLRIQVLPGKGGDILEFRDKQADVDVLWHADHEWVPPADRYVPSESKGTWNDHYPGGWQVNLPIAGYGRDIPGNAYGLHGESALLEWDATVTQADDAAVELTLETDLVRYPFEVTRTLRLPRDESRLVIDESVTNTGAVELEYMWQHHIALGQPLAGPSARLDMPATEGVVEEYGDGFPNRRLQSGAEFEWPYAPGVDGDTVDLRDMPPTESTIHDLAFASGLEEGWYAVTNDELDLGFGFEFPVDPFESVWYWQSFGGFEESPFFNTNYTAGIEPTTAYPSDDIPDAQRANGTIDTIDPGETIEAHYNAVTYRGYERVHGIDSGTVDGE
jgi:hypothetical protein